MIYRYVGIIRYKLFVRVLKVITIEALFSLHVDTIRLCSVELSNNR
jgi:hypothetical protein